jgi:D-alanine-D-alanine ligase
MRVAFTFNVRHLGAGMDVDAQAEAEFDEPATIEAIHDAVVASGHDCIDVEADDTAYERLRDLRDEIDIVFNIAEGKGGDAREAQVPAMLDLLGIPYTHATSLTHAVALDKALTKKIWRYHGLPTPRFSLHDAGAEPVLTEDPPFPVIVKPNGEGSSKGLFNDNVVVDAGSLAERVQVIRDAVGGKILVEEFLPGREFTVTVMGNPGIGEGVYSLPIVEQTYDAFPDDLLPFSSYEAKWLLDDLSTCVCPAVVEPGLRDAIVGLAEAAFTVLECRDIARVDIRLDASGTPQLLEINTLPGIYHDPEQLSYYPLAARAAGWDYTRMIGQIIAHAGERLAEESVTRVVVVPDASDAPLL